MGLKCQVGPGLVVFGRLFQFEPRDRALHLPGTVAEQLGQLPAVAYFGGLVLLLQGTGRLTDALEPIDTGATQRPVGAEDFSDHRPGRDPSVPIVSDRPQAASLRQLFQLWDRLGGQQIGLGQLFHGRHIFFDPFEGLGAYVARRLRIVDRLVDGNRIADGSQLDVAEGRQDGQRRAAGNQYQDLFHGCIPIPVWRPGLNGSINANP